MSVHDQFWSASVEELKRGYIENEHEYLCLLCGETVEKGIIFPVDDVLYDAQRYMRHHIEKEHESVFDHLSKLDKRLTGLSDHQTSLLRLFYQGKNDNEVQKTMGIGSASTIRNHRFALKEKERQAKVYLTMMELLRESDKQTSFSASGSVKNNKPAKESQDSALPATEKEVAELVSKYFPEGTDGPLASFPRKHKHRLFVLEQITQRFDPEHIYNEKEVNAVLEEIYADHVTLRRYLIDYALLNRKPDGSQYWVNDREQEESQMDRKQELKQMYKEVKTEAGVYQIKNTKNDKVFVTSSRNLKTMNGRKFMLQHGSHTNRELQKEWNEFGPEAFEFEVLEVLEIKDVPYFDEAEELEKLEDKWLEKLTPYGERGYNKEKKRK
ncbi:DUF2087 domain-containing protein [Brevibacillus reuszeri]|uniref:DUF2087 domain-containing protein n=1 Tax=Brevibacillus reuszeri TaxID=54915 RepID=UPI00289DFEFD|nr:DUF2087 domain-containing protein [Brevibacillus reuszeri]